MGTCIRTFCRISCIWSFANELTIQGYRQNIWICAWYWRTEGNRDSNSKTCSLFLSSIPWAITKRTGFEQQVTGCTCSFIRSNVGDESVKLDSHLPAWGTFINDVMQIREGGRRKEFLDIINSFHPTIKFTCKYNLKEKSTTFLDTTIYIVNNRIETDLYRKKCDRVQYLLPSSCHPSHIFKNIPFSLALRLVRICSTRENLL